MFFVFGSNAYYLNPHHDKRTWTIVFGAISLLVILLPTIHNFRIWSFLGVLTTTYTAWYMFIASISHGQVNLKTFSVSSNLLDHEWMMMIHSLMWIQLMLHSWIAADSYWNHHCIKLWITIYIWNHILECRLQMWSIQLPSTWRLFSQAQQTFSSPLEVTPSPCMTDWLTDWLTGWLYTRRLLLVGNPSLDGCWGWCFFYWLSRLLEDWRWVGRSEHSWNTQGCWRIVSG